MNQLHEIIIWFGCGKCLFPSPCFELGLPVSISFLFLKHLLLSFLFSLLIPWCDIVFSWSGERELSLSMLFPVSSCPVTTFLLWYGPLQALGFLLLSQEQQDTALWSDRNQLLHHTDVGVISHVQRSTQCHSKCGWRLVKDMHCYLCYLLTYFIADELQKVSDSHSCLFQN